jgi:hypothetical protein
MERYAMRVHKICNCNTSLNLEYLGSSTDGLMQIYRCLDCFPQQVTVEIPPQDVDKFKMSFLVDLMCTVIDGPEQGIITHEQWRAQCKRLYDYIRLLGYRPSGQWCSNL